MRCIGVVIPFEDACGFVMPIFGESAQSEITYFCETDSLSTITGFVKNASMDIIHPAPNKKEYMRGDPAPQAFYFCNSDGSQLFIGDRTELKCMLVRRLSEAKDCNYDMPIDAQYMIVDCYLWEDHGIWSVAKYVFTEYYKYLMTIDSDYASEWASELKKRVDKELSKKELEALETSFGNLENPSYSIGSYNYGDYIGTIPVSRISARTNNSGRISKVVVNPNVRVKGSAIVRTSKTIVSANAHVRGHVMGEKVVSIRRSPYSKLYSSMLGKDNFEDSNSASNSMQVRKKRKRTKLIRTKRR